MPDVMHLYADDSGTRHPDRHPGRVPAHGHDWFSLGGVVIRQRDEPAARHAHASFMDRWNLDPDEVFLHSSDIRGKTGAFTWLAALSDKDKRGFMDDLYSLMANPPFTGFACVIDRPGYNARYLERYGRQRWMLCKTAFAVLVERAAKFARSQNCKLRVFVERGDAEVDRWMKGYYETLRSDGMPFANDTMGKYQPLSAAELANTLYDFKTKQKSSPIMQIADLYLWPMSIGGYDRGNITYARLLSDGKLIDAQLQAEEIVHLGIKYSCFDRVVARP